MAFETGIPVNITATTQVTPSGSPARIVGFYVNSTTSGTIVFRNGSSSATALGTITPAVGFHGYYATMPSGVHATIANTLDVTIFVQAG